MGHIEWLEDTFEVRYAGQTIALLPKEYALLRHLYTWKNRTFTREQLLDSVWTMEAPTDRTVDDHIYRLRRKLAKWSHLFTIETVRGVGYRLNGKIMHAPQPQALNQSFADHVRGMLETYHGMGMGAAMHTLASHQDVLGIRLDPYYEIYLPFIRGDFFWFLHDQAFPMPEKCFYLLHIYYMIETDTASCASLFANIQPCLSQMRAIYRDELQIATIGIYTQTGDWERARAALQEARNIVEPLQSTGFTLYLHAQEALLDLMSDKLDAAEAITDHALEILQSIPMQRELGTFTLLRGLCQYRREQKAAARITVDQALEVTRSTQFIPHLIHVVRKLLLFYRHFGCDPEWKGKYEGLWRELSEEYHFDSLKKEIYAQLSNLH